MSIEILAYQIYSFEIKTVRENRAFYFNLFEYAEFWSKFEKNLTKIAYSYYLKYSSTHYNHDFRILVSIRECLYIFSILWNVWTIIGDKDC